MTPTDFALVHFRCAADDLIALALTHTEPVTDTVIYFDDDGPMLGSDGNLAARPGSIDLAESQWWFAEPVYREWVLAADYGRRPESRLAALCHARQFNALAATELWSAVPAERWLAVPRTDHCSVQP